MLGRFFSDRTRLKWLLDNPGTLFRAYLPTIPPVEALRREVVLTRISIRPHRGYPWKSMDFYRYPLCGRCAEPRNSYAEVLPVGQAAGRHEVTFLGCLATILGGFYQKKIDLTFVIFFRNFQPIFDRFSKISKISKFQEFFEKFSNFFRKFRKNI